MFDETEYSETIPGGDVQPEYWKEIAPGYWLSDWGNLYSFKSNKVLKPKRLDKKGHVGYSIFIDNTRKYYYQHRLMAEAFIPKDDESDDIVRHLNDIPDDNDPSNLSWGTRLDNWEDSVRNGSAYCITNEDRAKGMEVVRKPTRATNLQSGEVRDYISLSEAVRDLGVQQANAQKVATGQRPHTCGWKFEYIEED